MVTLIRNGTVVGFDGTRHVVIESGVVAFDESGILAVGASHDGPADTVIDATNMIVMPGLVNAHLHVTDTPFTRGWFEDYSDGAQANHTGLYHLLPTIRGSVAIEDELVAAKCTYAELLLGGSTTVVELGYDFEMMQGGDIATTVTIAGIAARMGIRAYIGPRYRSGRWSRDVEGRQQTHWYADRGRARFDDCVRFCVEHDGSHGGMIRTLLAPGQVDTCDVDMLEETRRVADRTGLPIHIHAGQSPTEYRSVVRRDGISTIALLERTGLLGPDFTIGHGMFLTEDGDVARFPPREIAALAESGTSIAHLPWVKARQGTAMKSFGRFLRAGVNMAIGTDSYPLDMFHEMRWAATMSKLMDGTPASISSAAVFHAATIGGATSLRRPDLGRLAPGCRADIVLVDVDSPHAVPMRDPFTFLVYSANASDVHTVIVEGRAVVRDRAVLTTDVPAALDRMREASTRVRARFTV
jgi:cytosine/adenosine deaminase-related metal-dependent hydrolase